MANFKALTNNPDKTTYYVGETITVGSSVEYSLGFFDASPETLVLSSLNRVGQTDIVSSASYSLGARSTEFTPYSDEWGTSLDLATNGLTGGNYEVKLTADSTNAAVESDETDNELSQAITIYDAVNLSLWNLNSLPQNLIAGESFALDLGLRNSLQEFGQDLSDYSVRVVLSTNDIFTTLDTTLATFTLDDFAPGDDGFGGSEYRITTTLDIPEFAAGSYYMGLILDDTNAFFEENEARTVQLWNEIEFGARDVDIQTSNLVVDDLSMEDGETITGRLDLSHTGTAGTLTQANLRVELVALLGGQIIPFELENTPLADLALEPGQTTSIDFAALISQGATPFVAGEYRLEVRISEDDSFDITDPTLSDTFTILPSGANAPAPDPAGNSDFDGNGYDDILFFNETTRKVGQFEMPEGSWSGIGGAGVGWEAVGIGLFDDDDTSADILWFNEGTGAVGRFDMEDGAIDRWDGIGFAGAGWAAVGSGDFNGDGVDDILWFNEATGTVGQFRMIDTQPQWVGVGSTGSGWDVAGIADFNSDGIDDILWENSDGSLGQFQMAADGSKEWISLAKMGSGWSVADTGAFYVDAADAREGEDILVFNESTGATGLYDIYEGTAYWESLGTAGSGWGIQGTGDFDADGDDDILWRHEDGRIGQYQLSHDGADNYFDTTWDSIGVAGTDWEVLI